MRPRQQPRQAKSLPTPDPWLSRQNEALKLRGLSVTLELCGSRLRLRASRPRRPKDEPSSPWKQQRLPIGLEYPARTSETVELAETLGRPLERERTGIEPFDWTPWGQLGGHRGGCKAGSLSRDAVTGGVALSMTRHWWEARGGRGRSAEDSWDANYRQPLATLRRSRTFSQPTSSLWLRLAARPRVPGFGLVGLPLPWPRLSAGVMNWSLSYGNAARGPQPEKPLRAICPAIKPSNP